ncbi:MAG: transcriptional regulator [Rhizobiaceae bacterium]|nr:transcriptional regulator [Rhizobiaceae bacterium]
MKLAYVRRLIAVGLLLSSAMAFFASPLFSAAKLAFTYSDPFSIAEFRLRGLSEEDYVLKIDQAIADEDFSEAQQIVEIARENGVALSPEIVERTQQDLDEAVWQTIREFSAGFATGESDTPSKIMGTLAADYLIYGDIRDVATEAPKAIAGQDYDALTLGLATFGIVTLVPGTGAVDLGAAVLKTAKRAGKMSAGMARSLTRTATSAIDIGALKVAMNSGSTIFRSPSAVEIARIFGAIDLSQLRRLDFSELRKLAAELVPVDVAALRRRFGNVLRPSAVDEFGEFAGSTTRVVRAGGVKAGFRSLELAENPAELARFGKLADKAGTRTSSILRILGKAAIQIGELIYLIVASLIYAAIWLLGALWTIVSFIFNVRRLIL